MKKIILIAIVGFACITLPQKSYAQQNVFKINILSPIFKTFNASFEHALGTEKSLQLGFFYTGFSDGDTGFSGFGITPEYRFYLSESTEAPDGFYAAPFVRYMSFKLTDDFDNSEGTLNTFGGGVIVGRQWIFKEKFSLDLFLGPAYYSGSVKVTSGSGNFDTGAFDGFTVRGGVTFGLAF